MNERTGGRVTVGRPQPERRMVITPGVMWGHGALPVTLPRERPSISPAASGPLPYPIGRGRRQRHDSETQASLGSMGTASQPGSRRHTTRSTTLETIMRFRKLKSGVMAIAATAAIFVAAAPAEAQSCKFGGVTINCEYTIAEYKFDNGVLQQFVIGTDSAVWTRWTNEQQTTWSSWESLGGTARSGVVTQRSWQGDTVLIGVIGTDGYWWSKYRNLDGSWNAWQRYGVSFP
ncbi:hypothetical protein AB0L85_09730 [Streptomyces sp. NPDC052051]|uniref:hypothetical protein n=1 Tax=Streptomyces sp. NPDC052051 TaxID=3154649 RepID=UPI003430689A